MARMRGQNLTHGIAHELGVAIVTGVYSGDNPIPIEAQLCRKYEASRPVLREAVKMLTAKGQLAGFTAAALRFSIQTTNRYKGVQLASIADHKKVADAIFAGKSAAAGEAMRKLIQEALDLISRREARQTARRSSARTGR